MPEEKGLVRLGYCYSWKELLEAVDSAPVLP